MNYIVMFVKAVLLVCLVLFTMWNQEMVNVILVAGRIEYAVPLYAPIFVAIIFGALVSALFFGGKQWKVARDLKKANQDLQNLQDEISRLQNLPFSDDSK